MKREIENIINKYNSSKFIQSKFVQDFTSVGEVLYLVVIVLSTLYYGLLTTMVRGIKGIAPMHSWLYLVIVALIWIKVLLGYAKNITHFFVAMLALLVMQYISGFVGEQDLMVMGLLIIGAYEVNFDKILRTYVITMSTLMIVAFALARMGVTEYLIYNYEGRRLRYALGSVYPTDFMSHVLFITLALLYLHRNKLNMWITAVFFGFITVLYYFTDARAASWSTMMAIMVCVALSLFEKRKIELSTSIIKCKKWIKCICIFSPIIGCLGFSLCCVISMAVPEFKNIFPAMISDRITYTVTALKEYGVPAFGCPISMHGAGGTTEFVEDYFFIDCSYMWVLFVYGLVVLLIFMFLFVAIGYKFQNDWYMLVILFVIALDCTIEHHWTNISYNIFMVALVAECGINKINLITKKGLTN